MTQKNGFDVSGFLYAIFKIEFFALMLVAVSSLAVHAQNLWEPGFDPMFRNVSCVVFEPNGYIVAGTEGRGVLISTDDGNSWLPNAVSMEYEYINAVACTDNGAILANGLQGLYRSTDTGQNWTTQDLNAGHIYTLLTVTGPYIYGTDTGFEYVLAATDSGILYSSDHGNSWSTMSWMLKTRVTAITRLPGASLAAINGTKIAYSADGDAWNLYPAPKRPHNFNTIRSLRNADILLGTDSGIYISHDSGATWSDYSLALDTLTVQSIAQDSSGDIFVGLAPGGLRRSTDQGASWQTIVDDTTGIYSTSVEVRANGEIYYSTLSDFYISSDGGEHWHGASGIIPEQTNALAVAPDGTIFAGTKAHGFYTSVDQGLTWIHQGYVNTGVMSLIAGSKGTVYAAMEGSYGAVISSDDGVQWSDGTMPYQGEHYYAVGIGGDQEIYIAGASTLYHSTDSGKKFSPTKFMEPTRALLGDAYGNVFAGCSQGVYRSAGNGAPWLKSDTGLTIGFVYALATSPRGTLLAGGSGVQRSTDHGATWEPVVSSLHNVSVSCFTNARDGSILLGSDSGVYRSTDDGISWYSFSNGLPQMGVHTMATDSAGYVYASFTSGAYDVYRSTAPIPATVATAELQASDMMLFPNPTSGIISVQGLPLDDITVSVFNTLGETVMEQKNPPAPDFTLDLSKLVPGTYYIRFSSANSVVTQKIVRE